MASPTLRLDSMQFFGRLASTYHAMFGITVEQLRGLRGQLLALLHRLRGRR